MVKKLLRAVSSKFIQLASTLEQFGDLETMSVEEVIGRLKAHEERLKGRDDQDDRKLLLTHQEWSARKKKERDSKDKQGHGGPGSSRGRGKGRGRHGGGRGGRGRGNHGNQKTSSASGSNNYDESKVQCYNCQDFGHYASECQNPKKERNQEANLIQDDNEPALLLSSIEGGEENGEVYLNEENVTPNLRSRSKAKHQSNIWYLDCGASNHMTGMKANSKP